LRKQQYRCAWAAHLQSWFHTIRRCGDNLRLRTSRLPATRFIFSLRASRASVKTRSNSIFSLRQRGSSSRPHLSAEQPSDC
jgi:hypothetical protein